MSFSVGVIPGTINFDGFLKSQKPFGFVIPVKTGIQEFYVFWTPAFAGVTCRCDGRKDFLRVHQFVCFYD